MRASRGVRWTIRGTLIVAACAGFWRLGAAVGDDGVGVRLDQQFLGLREHHQRSGRPVLQ